MIVPFLEQHLELQNSRGDLFEFDEEEAEPNNRGSVTYLFHTAQHQTRCYEVPFPLSVAA